MDEETLDRINTMREMRRRGILSRDDEKVLREMERRFLSQERPDTLTQQVRQISQAQTGAYDALEAFGAPEPGARAQGRAEARRRGGPVIAAATRAAPFGTGTTATAIADYVGKNLMRGERRTFGESMEFARGVGEQLREDNPGASLTGTVASIPTSMLAFHALPASIGVGARTLPVGSVLNLKAGQTIRNFLRLSGTGAAVAGATTAQEEGGMENTLRSTLVGAVATPMLGHLLKTGMVPANAARNIGISAGAGAVAGAGIGAATADEEQSRFGAAWRGGIRGAVVGGGVGAVPAVIGAGVHKALGTNLTEHAAVHAIAERLGEAPKRVAARMARYIAATGRAPNYLQASRPEVAENFSAIGSIRPSTGRLLREAETATLQARPSRLPETLSRAGGAGTTPEAQRQLLPKAGEFLAPTAGRPVLTPDAAGRVAPPGPQIAQQMQGGKPISGPKQLGDIRDRWMDRVMSSIGRRTRVNVDESFLTHPDVRTAMTPVLQRHTQRLINIAHRRASIAGRPPPQSIPVTLQTVDRIRRVLNAKSQVARDASGAPLPAPAGQDAATFRGLMDRLIRRVAPQSPRYVRAVQEYARRSERARWAGEVGISPLSGKKHTLYMEQVQLAKNLAGLSGMRLRARREIVDGLRGTQQETERMLRRIANDEGLQARLGAVMKPADAQNMVSIAKSYGVNLNILEGARIGERVLTARTGPFVQRVSSRFSPERQEAIERTARRVYREALSDDPEIARRTMEKISRSPGLRKRLQFALSREEYSQIEKVAARFGRRLEMAKAAEVGSKVLDTNPRGFQAALNEAGATPHGRVAAAAGARGAVRSAASESQASAIQTASRIAERPGSSRFPEGGGVSRRLRATLGDQETSAMRRAAAFETRGAMQMGRAAPRGDLRGAQVAEETANARNFVSGLIALSGRGSGAFLAHFALELVRQASIPRKVAERVAQKITNPAELPLLLEQLRKARVSYERLQKILLDSAVATGILSAEASK